MLALLRLTELEVHGTDLEIGAKQWSDLFVDTALDARLRWLPARRLSTGSGDTEPHATWRLETTDGPAYTITTTQTETTDSTTDISADATIRGSKREILRFVLGRLPLNALDVSGDEHVAAAFRRAFPGP